MSRRVHQIDATHVEIVEKRWNVFIRITKPDGSVVEFVASADAALTDRSGIYFARREEYDEDLERL